MVRPSDARERLLKAANRLIYVKGYTAVAISEICREAGVQKGSFYHFFPSKLDLVLEIVKENACLDNASCDEMVQSEGPPLLRLEKNINSYVNQQLLSYEENANLYGCPLGNLVVELSAKEPSIRNALRKTFNYLEKGYVKVILEAIEQGEIDHIDAHQAASAIIALIEGVSMMAKLYNDPRQFEKLPQEILRLLGAPTQKA